MSAGLSQCPHCATLIKTDSIRCKHCRAELEARGPGSSAGLIVWLGVILIIFTAVLIALFLYW